MLERISTVLEPYTDFLSVLMVVSIVLMLISFAALPSIVARIPRDYFIRGKAKRKTSGWILWLLRNLIGVVLITAGILMLFLPGQGVLTILAGLYVIDAKWKFNLERRLVHIPGVLRAVNWIRNRKNQPDLEV